MKFVHTLSFLLLLSPLTHANIKFVSDTGFIIENQVSVSKSPQSVWHALTQKVDVWWPKDHTWWNGMLSIQPEAGGCFCEELNQRSAIHMTISFVEPNKVLRMTGGLGPLQEMGVNGALTWQLKEKKDGTQIILTYSVSGINPSGFDTLANVVDQVQGIQLGALAKFVAQ